MSKLSDEPRCRYAHRAIYCRRSTDEAWAVMELFINVTFSGRGCWALGLVAQPGAKTFNEAFYQSSGSEISLNVSKPLESAFFAASALEETPSLA